MKAGKVAKPKSKSTGIAKTGNAKGKPHSTAKSLPSETPSKSRRGGVDCGREDTPRAAAGSGKRKHCPSPSPPPSVPVDDDGLGKRGRPVKTVTSQKDVAEYLDDEGLLTFRKDFEAVHTALWKKPCFQEVPSGREARDAADREIAEEV